MEEKIDLLLNEMREMKQEMNEVRQEIREVKKQQMKNTAELKGMDSLILDEVERVHDLMLKKTDDLKQKIG